MPVDRDVSSGGAQVNQSGSVWPSTRVDAIVSVILSYLSVLIGGFGLYMTYRTWQSFPLVLVALVLWGISCVGLKRISSSIRRNDSDG